MTEKTTPIFDHINQIIIKVIFSFSLFVSAYKKSVEFNHLCLIEQSPITQKIISIFDYKKLLK